MTPKSRSPRRVAPEPLPVVGGNPAPTPPTLAEQASNFTAEGAPPPGKVATSPPVRSCVPTRPKR